MSTITFTFSDLCAFFSRYPSRIVVGLIATEDQPPEHVHAAKITIKQNGVEKRVYQGLDQISGDIILNVHPKTAGGRHTRLKSSSRRRTRNQVPGEERHPYDLVMSIDKRLHQGEKLNVKPSLCRVRMHFNNGELYSLNRFTDVNFKDLKTGKLHPKGPFEIASEVGLEVNLNDSGYAVWHFGGEAEDFVFKGGQNYQVEVANQAEAVAGDHFKYFYNIVRPKPKQIWVPVAKANTEQRGPRTSGTILCTAGDYGNQPTSPPPSGPGTKAVKARKKDGRR